MDNCFSSLATRLFTAPTGNFAANSLLVKQQPGPPPEPALGQSPVDVSSFVPTLDVNPEKSLTPATSDAAQSARAWQDNATILEEKWAQQLGPEGGKSVVGIISTDGWVKDSFVYLQELADSIIASGGQPRLIFPGRGEDGPSQMEGIQSLLVPGGGDVDPSFYGSVKGPGMANSSTDKELDKFELDCINRAYAQGLPMLGMCRGEQLMNVAGGGTLIQDIGSEHPDSRITTAANGTLHQEAPAPIQHYNEASLKDRKLRRFSDHEIETAPGSRIREVLGPLTASVNSIHHQCIGSLSPMLYVTAWALDGVPEAVERKGMPWQVGTQFHPEWNRLEQPRFQGFFDNLVNDGQLFAEGMLGAPASMDPVLPPVAEASPRVLVHF